MLCGIEDIEREVVGLTVSDARETEGRRSDSVCDQDEGDHYSTSRKSVLNAFEILCIARDEAIPERVEERKPKTWVEMMNER